MLLRQHIWSLLATTSVITCAAQGAAFAQTSEPQAEQERSDVVIVTAQRRSEDLQDTPVAVTALTADSLEQLNVSNTADLMQVVPSLQVSTQTAGNGGGSATFFLRGMGQQRSGNGSEPAIGVYVDDFYYPSLQGNLFDIIDVSQVEVLRGPQGTLFGRNTIGGAIRYTTREPELGEFGVNAKATLGTFNRMDVSGAINVPLGDIAALRLTAGSNARDGYVHVQSGGKDAGGTTTDVLRLQLKVEPTDYLRIDISGQTSSSQLDGFTYTVPGPLTPVPPAPGATPTLPFIWNATVAPRIGAPRYTDALKSTCFYCEPGTGRREFANTDYSNAFATIAWDISDDLTLKSLTGWQKIKTLSSSDLDSTPLPIFLGGIARSSTEAFSQEFQLNGQAIDDRLNYVGGVYYYTQLDPSYLPVARNVTLGAPASNITLEDRKTISMAAYIDGSFDITDQLSVLAGFRHSEDRKKVYTSTEARALLSALEKKFASDTYRVGLMYDWTPDFMTYANVATGFRAGGFNPYNALLTPANQPFDPEESTSYEVGSRMQFFDGRLTFNPTVFYVDWDKIQVQSVRIIDVNTGAGAVVLQNAGTARSKGAELEWSGEVTDDFRLFGSIAYLDIKYLDVGSAQGITLATKPQRAPELTYSVGAAHTFTLGDGGRIVSSLNYGFQDDQFSTPTDSDKLLLPSYALLSARIEFTIPDEHLSIALFATNLTDEEYYVGGVNYYSNVGAAHYDVGRPREIGVTAQFKY
ncbi:MAG: TonB-dependent receptor [Hyphomonadaceae bacterium]|nr:TonB-dependent receptor [Hyphomonadaceae bacterium]